MSEEKKGDKKFKEAKENITISIFNWSKDYASAASSFDEALKLYMSAGKYEKSLNTLNQLIKCNEKMTDPWAVARNYESMLDIYMDHYPNIEYEIIHSTVTKSFINFRMAESLDKGLQMLGKVTKFLIKRGQMKEGVEILQQAYQIAMEEEKSFKKKDIFTLIVETYLENDLIEESIKMYYENIKYKNGVDCDQEGLIIVILILVLGEPQRAEKQMYELGNIIPSFLESNECESADNLIKYYKQGKSEKFKKQTTRAAITTIFPLIIIRKLRAVIVPSSEAYEKGNEEEKQEIMKKILF